MKYLNLIGLLFLGIFALVGCDAPPSETDKKIDKTVESSKELIDVLGDKAKDVLNDKELQTKLKDILKDVKIESEELEKILKEKGKDWQAKIEELKKDPEFKEKLKDLGDDARDILKKLEEAAKEIEKE